LYDLNFPPHFSLVLGGGGGGGGGGKKYTHPFMLGNVN
jgi:hypothetical protein